MQNNNEKFTMEYRWRLPEGKTLSETKVSDRVKELHMTSSCLNTITSHLTRSDREQAAKEAEEAKISQRKAFSHEMTKNWTDSVKNLAAARQQQLEEMLHQQNDDNFIKYLSIKKDQEAERNVYVNEVRHKLMQRQDFPKALASAYLFSSVLHEREKQKELSQQIKAMNQELVKDEVKDMWKDVAKYNEEQVEKKKKLQEKDDIYAKELVQQVEAIRQAEVKERAAKIEEELTDQVRAQKEADKIEAERLKRIAESRQLVRDAAADFKEAQQKERAKAQEEERRSQAMTKMMQEGRDRIQAMMKQKAREAQEKRLAKGLSVFDNTMEVKRNAELKLIFDKGIEKIEADEKERNRSLQEKQARMRKERIDEHKQQLEKQAADEKRNRELKKWEMLNRFKSNELERKYNEEKKLKAEEDRKKLMEIQQSEMAKKKERLDAEITDELAPIIAKNADDDTKYMEYAESVRNLTVENAWSTYPIDKTIKKYKETVMGIKPSMTECQRLQKEKCTKCANKAHSVEIPGKRTHCPASDPSRKCKHQKDRLYH